MIGNLTWSQVGTIFGILALLAGAVAVARVSYFKAQLDALRSDRDDLRVRIEILESDKAAQAVENEKLEALLDAEKKKAEVLEGIVNGRDILLEIRNTLSTQIETANNRQIAIYDKLNVILKAQGLDG